MTEPRSTRLRRRLVTVPTMLGATALGLAGFPVLAPLLLASDLIRGRRRLPRIRVYLFALQYGINDSVEIVLAPLYWARAGMGTSLASGPSLDRHRRVQWWSLDLLARRAEQLLGLPIEVDERSRSALGPGPVVVISRHVSLLDASLPALVYGREGWAVRGVVMAELLGDPGFDLLYGRLGSVFLPREDGPAARRAIGAMARSIAATDGAEVAVGIFPEGRLFRPEVRDRLLARLADTAPDRADRLDGLTGLLPPRPTGLRILLQSIPDADLVLLDHEGLDDLARLVDLADAAPVDRPIRVTARRIPRHDIPGLGGDGGMGADSSADDSDRFTAWLDDLWVDLDRSLSPTGAGVR